MPMRTTQLANDEYYHVYNRGNSKQVIFHDDQDHRYFINLLDIMNGENRIKSRFGKNAAKGENIVSIGAYCLMPNHFHLLLKQENEQGIKLFMQKLSTAYVMYYNKKYKRTGALFEGRFKSKYAGDDIYLKYLFSYIHLNPLKIYDENWKSKAKSLSRDMSAFLKQYPYSSFGEYSSFTFSVVNKSAFPDYFPTNESFTKNLTSWFLTDQPL